METILCMGLLLVGFIAFIYWFSVRPQVQRAQLIRERARQEGRQMVYRETSEEMGLPLETFERLEAWAHHNRYTSDKMWPFITNLKDPRKAELRVGTLGEIIEHYNGHAVAAVRAIYYGVQAGGDAAFHRQWSELVNRYL